LTVLSVVELPSVRYTSHETTRRGRRLGEARNAGPAAPRTPCGERGHTVDSVDVNAGGLEMTRGWRVQAASLAIAVAFAACGVKGSSTYDSLDDGGVDDGPAADDSSVPTFGQDGGGGSPGVVQPTGPVTDFPTAIVDGNAPANAAALFGPPGQGAASGGPCLVEPETDTFKVPPIANQ
jgi:hypothetical protein